LDKVLRRLAAPCDLAKLECCSSFGGKKSANQPLTPQAAQKKLKVRLKQEEALVTHADKQRVIPLLDCQCYPELASDFKELGIAKFVAKYFGLWGHCGACRVNPPKEFGDGMNRKEVRKGKVQ